MKIENICWLATVALIDNKYWLATVTFWVLGCAAGLMLTIRVVLSNQLFICAILWGTVGMHCMLPRQAGSGSCKSDHSGCQTQQAQLIDFEQFLFWFTYLCYSRDLFSPRSLCPLVKYVSSAIVYKILIHIRYKSVFGFWMTLSLHTFLKDVKHLGQKCGVPV